MPDKGFIKSLSTYDYSTITLHSTFREAQVSWRALLPTVQIVIIRLATLCFWLRVISGQGRSPLQCQINYNCVVNYFDHNSYQLRVCKMYIRLNGYSNSYRFILYTPLTNSK